MDAQIYLQKLMEELDFPAASRAVLCAEHAKLLAAPEVPALLDAAAAPLFGTGDWKADIAPLLARAADISGVHPYTVDMLFLLAQSRRLRENYAARGIGEDIFINSMMDLRYKLLECWRVHGIWGTFVAWWHPRFYRMERFGLGRLQFEAVSFAGAAPITVAGHTVRPGDTVYNMHIPSAGPLTRELRLDAYRRAYDFYKPGLQADWMAFVCNSWLLYPPYREIWGPQSNIRGFADDFLIYQVDEAPFTVGWRIWGAAAQKPVAALPEDTSMQRGFKRWLAEDRPNGVGSGLFIYDGAQVLK